MRIKTDAALAKYMEEMHNVNIRAIRVKTYTVDHPALVSDMQDQKVETTDPIDPMVPGHMLNELEYEPVEEVPDEC